MATIKQVAHHARVSVATVSRVINQSGFVSEDLQQRVYHAMETLNYKPSALARGLRNQRTQVVGVLIPQLDQPFFSALAFSIEQALFANGYQTLICSSEENREKEDAYIDMLLRQRVDGVIFAPRGESTGNITHLLDRDIPVVIVDRDLPATKEVSRVLTDNRQGGYDGMRHLLEIGHRHIGIIGAPRYNEAMLQRIHGAQHALRDFGIQPRDDMLVTDSTSQSDIGYQVGRTLLERPDPPTAIFALTDVMAVGVIHTAALLGLRLPDDLSIVGFDNIPLASYVVPELTTVAQPIYQIGETAAQELLRRMQDPSLPVTTTILKDQLVLRKSTLPHKG